MAEFRYTPDDRVKVHAKGAIDLLCKPFQSHENGLPEWPKNSADEYARRDADAQAMVIVLIFCDQKRGRPPSISCLDFAGITSAIIEKHFRDWASPDAAARGKEPKGVQGGHGNGGKCYMTQMFEHYAKLCTVAEGRGNCYGVKGGGIRFGYIPTRDKGRDFEVEDTGKYLADVLKDIGCTIEKLPGKAQEGLAAATGFTLVTGVGPKGYKGRLPVAHLIAGLAEHPQMIQTLQLCEVFVVSNGTVLNAGKPLTLPDIEPMDGAEKPRVIAIPKHVKDPVSGDRVSTTAEGNLPPGELVLRTSRTSMRWKKKTRHSILFEAQSGYVGYVQVPELDIQSSYRDRIYGSCRLASLEPYRQNDRARLAESPLTRGIERFVAHQIQEYAQEFEIKDKRKYDEKEKKGISQINEALDRWKNRFLSEVMKGMWGDGDGPRPPSPPLPSGTPTRIELSLTHSKIGRGVSIRPTLKFFDDEGRRIRAVAFRWVSEDCNIAMVDEDLGIIDTFACGNTVLYAEAVKGRLRSNRVSLEVVPIQAIRISPERIEVTAGGRSRLEASCTLAGGSEAKDVFLIWTESNPNIARVSSSGLVFGCSPGETEVIAADDGVMAENSAVVRVTKGEGGGPGRQTGRGFPKVLVSGEIDRDPETGDYVHLSAEDPPVWQRVQDVDRNIWWINSAAPLAKLYLDADKGYGYGTREWRIYHVERYVDVVAQIALSFGPSGSESVSANEWILNWGSKVAEVQGAAVADLVNFIATGVPPGE